MPDPWFDQTWSFLPGTLYGVVAGIWGGACGMLMRYRSAFYWIYYFAIFLTLCGFAMLLLGVFAYYSGQPYFVWYALLLPGAIGSLQMPMFLWMVRQRHQQNEMRAMEAREATAVDGST